MPYNLRRNANGRRESRPNDDETTIEAVESVNSTTFASTKTGEGVPRSSLTHPLKPEAQGSI